jgi:hypothetical protein
MIHPSFATSATSNRAMQLTASKPAISTPPTMRVNAAIIRLTTIHFYD